MKGAKGLRKQKTDSKGQNRHEGKGIISAKEKS